MPRKADSAAYGHRRAVLLVARILLLPPFIVAVAFLLPFAWALDQVESMLYGTPRLAGFNRDS